MSELPAGIPDACESHDGRGVAGSERAWWALSAEGVAHLPMLQGPRLLSTRCQRSLPLELGRCGMVPEGTQRCVACFASLLGRPRAGEDVLTTPEAEQSGAGLRPPPLLDRVAEEIAVRFVLQGVIALAEQACVLTDPGVRTRLIALAGTAASVCRERGCAEQAPAACRLSVIPGGQPVPEDPATGTRVSCWDTSSCGTAPEPAVPGPQPGDPGQTR